MPVRRLTPPPETLVGGAMGATAPAGGLPTVSGSRSLGDLVILSATFSDPTSTTPPVDPVSGFSLINPSPAPVCTVRRPDGTEVILDVTVTGTTYASEFVATQAGTWWYRFAAPSGQFQGVGESFVMVKRRRS